MPLAASMRRKRPNGRPASRANRRRGSQASGGDVGRRPGPGGVVVDMLYPCRLIHQPRWRPDHPLSCSAHRCTLYPKCASTIPQVGIPVEGRARYRRSRSGGPLFLPTSSRASAAPDSRPPASPAAPLRSAVAPSPCYSRPCGSPGPRVVETALIGLRGHGCLREPRLQVVDQRTLGVPTIYSNAAHTCVVR